MRNKNLWLVGCALGLVLHAPAFAQSEQSGDSVAPEVGPVIIVTAQKRVQDIQDVPLSISVVDGGEFLEQGAASLTDYAGFVPGMQVTNEGSPGQATITLRGVAPLTGAQTVGTYLDEAPVGSSSIYNRSGGLALDLLPYDIERVEVLKGPQGTLYGATSIGGLLKYVTVSPDVEAFGVRGGVGAFLPRGADGLGWAGNVRATVPVVVGKLGVSGSFSWRSTPGHVDTVNNPALTDQNDYEQRGGRLALLWKPSSALTVKLGGIWQTVEAEGNGLYAADLLGERVGRGRTFNNFLPEPSKYDLEYYSGVLNYDFDSVVLTSVSTYSETSTRQTQDGSLTFGALFPLLTQGAIPPGLTPFTINLGLEKFTQEMRLASSSGGRFEWLIGGFFADETSRNSQLVRSFDMAGNPIAPLDPLAIAELPATYKEYALFGNGTFRFSDQFELSAGLRWAKNKQTFSEISGGVLLPPADNPGRSSEDVLTYSVSPQFRINDDAMVYARVSSGYRPGGPNVVFPGVPDTVDADRLTNYELGVKAELAEGVASLDLAAFYMDWSDIQVTRSFGGVAANVNGGKASSKGIEGTIVVRPAPGLSLTGMASYTDATLSEDVPEISGFDGDRLPNVPKFSGAFRADYGFDVSDTVNGAFGVSVRHAGGNLSLVEGDSLVARSSGFTVVDVNGSVTLDDRWTLRAYARNLFDNEGELGRRTITDGLNQPIYIAITPVQPRTVGVALELNY